MNKVPFRLLRTSNHPCSYLQGRSASTTFLDPEIQVTKHINTLFSQRGFRRSGDLLYKPNCDTCNLCISCRIPINDFTPKKSHHRIIKGNSDLRVVEADNLNCDESYKLYELYINNRHKDGDMFPPSKDQFNSFLKKKTDETVFFKFFNKGKLVSVSVTDVLSDGLSAVYSFYNPFENKRSLGTYSILYQTRSAFERELSYLYLGYWVKNCRKMDYKIKFRPLQMLSGTQWITIN